LTLFNRVVVLSLLFPLVVKMQEILYREVPTPDTAQVIQWLHGDWHPSIGKKSLTPQGIRVQLDTPTLDSKDELST
jgi:hypothetical protein